MSSMQSGGATPEIRQNYSGGNIVFNAIHAWSGRRGRSAGHSFYINIVVKYKKYMYLVLYTGGRSAGEAFYRVLS